jgi:hypothetical protein
MIPITFKGKSYNSVFEMPQEVRQAYQKDQVRRTSTKSLTDIGDTPAQVKDVYRPVSPIIDPEYSTIEPESSMVIRGLIFGILWSLVLIGIVFLAIEFFRLIL